MMALGSLDICRGSLHSAHGAAYSHSSFAWSGPAVLDVCVIRSHHGNLLVLATDGTLHALNSCNGATVTLCAVDLPKIATVDNEAHFGAPSYRLHASSDGGYAAIVVDRGREGLVVETQTGAVTMRLDGGSYHQDTVPFSACFLLIDGRELLVHRTQWNRLDVSDPASGELLTHRHIAPVVKAGEHPDHYLDYFHGQLLPSADSSLLLDSGWVWHPVSVPRVWSVTQWLRSNPWESEDGGSVTDLTVRDDWSAPACWIDEQHVALWGLGKWDEEESLETGQGPGVLILDVADSKQPRDARWSMTIVGSVIHLFSDGMKLYVAADTGTTIWDIASRAPVDELRGFTARLMDQTRGTLVSFQPDAIRELAMPWHSAGAPPA